MIEVLVTLFIISVGLLGVAKMHALALNSTKTSGSRALASILASSMASAMHANPAYWAKAGTATTAVKLTCASAPCTSYSSFTLGTDTVLSGITTAPNCLGTAAATSCITPDVPTAVAAYDLLNWAYFLSQQLPPPSTGTLGAVSCTSTAGIPVTCTITVNWSENAVTGVNAAAMSSTSQSAADQQLILVVNP
jgi:type IV pilus assembly protein PilV